MSESKKPTVSEIEAREKAATEGPWNVCEQHNYEVLKGECRGCECGENFITDAVVDAQTRQKAFTTQTRDDSAFIAGSRTDIPYLLDLVERMGDTLKLLYAWLDNQPDGRGQIESKIVKEARALLEELKL